MPRKIRDDLDGVVTAFEVDTRGRKIGGPVTLKAGDVVPDGVTVGEHVLAPADGSQPAPVGAFDPGKANVAEVNAYLASLGDDPAGAAERDRVLAAEAAGENRKGIVEGPHSGKA